MKTLQAQLADLYTPKSIFVGVGNRLKGDDGIGPVLIERICRGAVIAPEQCIDAGVAPENYLEKIIKQKPDTIFLIDATDFKGQPGEIRIFNHSEITGGSLSTHALSLQMFCQYIRARIPACQVFLIGIQPASCILGNDLSTVALVAVEELEKELTATFLPTHH